MKKIITLVLITFALTAFAQNNAETLLNEVSKKAKTYENISIDFKYELNNPSENIKQETKGDVTIQNDKYVLNVLEDIN